MAKIFSHALGAARVRYAPGKEVHFFGGVFVLEDDNPDKDLILEQFAKNPYILPIGGDGGAPTEVEREEASRKADQAQERMPRIRRRLLKGGPGTDLGLAPEINEGGPAYG
jgi:hypothetical protein